MKELTFENWAYPPSFGPRHYRSTLKTAEGSTVRLSAIAGLTKESSPAEGEYGVYFYCNGRLVARALKSYEVGFTKGVAGLPHPDVSLVRVIVMLSGEAQLMPWNSSKSGINWNHHVFVAMRPWLVQVVKDYASLSRRLAGDWPEKVFKYESGAVEEVDLTDLPEVSKSYLPPLPQSRPRYADVIKESNAKLAGKKPWVRGLYEGVAAVDLISHQRLEQKNRICLILLDSTLEIGLKEYLVNESGTFYADSQLLSMFKQRHLVDAEVKKYVKLSADTWKQITYYHQLRSKMVHERSIVQITDDQLDEFRVVVESVLRKLFRLKFR